MDTVTKTPRKIILYTAGLALAALVIGLLAVTMTAGPALAQGPGTGGNTATNTWPNPQPCGSDDDSATAFMEEPHEVTEGHFALFDAYWEQLGGNRALDDTNTGVLHINECPPLMVTTREDDGFGTITEIITRTAREKGMDIDEAIMHVLDDYKVDVVPTNANATSGQLSLEEYPEVRRGLGLGTTDPVATGTQVWWLKLDDPDTTDVDETSDLGMGFSTALFDDKYWLTRAEGKPMRYKFVVESYPANPTNPEDVPHFFTYEAPREGNARATLVWDGFRPSVEKTDMLMDPGEYRALQWVFTKPGTYVLTVTIQGSVRNANNPPLGAGLDWKPISGNDTEAAAARYTIHVGDELIEMEPPLFGVNLSVAENSPGGVNVGDPIPVYNTEAKVLYYDLIGKGSENFNLATTTDPHTVRVVVADGASLDYETTPSYDLALTVTDRVDHEDNRDLSVDDGLAVRIALVDQEPGLVLEADRKTLNVGETVNFTTRYEPTPEQLGQEFGYQWEKALGGNRWHVFDLGTAPDAPTWAVAQSGAITETYRATVVLPNASEPLKPTFVNSNDIEVTWK